MTTLARAVAVASRPEIVSAAQGVLAQASAIDAVVAGVFAACALEATVLLGPVQLLVGGAGVGLRAIDGRPRQPGIGTTRPRGFKDDEPIAAAAHVAAPALPAALAAALAMAGGGSLMRAMSPALELARPNRERRAVLERIAQRGPAALAEDPLADELIAASGKLAGGVLTRDNLSSIRPAVEPCHLDESRSPPATRVPWAIEGDASAVEIVAAADLRGVIAIACYEVRVAVVTIDELGLAAAAYAEPVRRGLTRVRPGEPRPTACPMALASTGAAGAGVIDVALGLRGSSAADPGAALAELLRRLLGPPPIALTLAAGEGTALGVLRTREGARPLR